MVVGWINNVVNNAQSDILGTGNNNRGATNTNINEMLRNIGGAGNIMTPISEPLPQINQPAMDQFIAQGGLQRPQTTISQGPNLVNPTQRFGQGAITPDIELPQLDSIPDRITQEQERGTTMSQGPSLVDPSQVLGQGVQNTNIQELPEIESIPDLSDLPVPDFTPIEAREEETFTEEEADETEPPSAFRQFMIAGSQKVKEFSEDVQFYHNATGKRSPTRPSAGDFFMPGLSSALSIRDTLFEMPDYYRSLDSATTRLDSYINETQNTVLPNNIVQDVKAEYSIATGTPINEIDTEEMFNILDQRNIQLRQRRVDYEEMSELFGERQDSIGLDQKLSQESTERLNPIMSEVYGYLKEQGESDVTVQRVLNNVNVGYNSHMSPAITAVNSIRRVADTYNNEFGEDADIRSYVDDSMRLYNIYAEKSAEYAKYLAIYGAKGALDKIEEETGSRSVRNFLWGGFESRTNIELAGKTPYEHIEELRTNATKDLILREMGQAYTEGNDNRGIGKSLMYVIQELGTIPYLMDVAITNVIPGRIYRADAGGLSVIDGSKTKGSVFRFWNSIYRNLDEGLPAVIGSVRSMFAKSSRLARTNPAVLSQWSRNTARRLRSAGIKVDARKIETSAARAQHKALIVERNFVPSLGIEASIINLDKEADREINQNFMLGGLVFFDTFLPVGRNIGKTFARGRSTGIGFTDAYEVMRESVRGSASEMGLSGIDDILDTLDIGYHEMASATRKQMSAGNQAAVDAMNETLKKQYANTMAKNMDAFKAGIIGRSRVVNAQLLGAKLDTVRTPIDPEAIRYAESVLADISNKGRNVADMIKADFNIEGTVVFGPFKSNILVSADLQNLSSMNYNIPQNINRLASPDGIRDFNPNQIVTSQQINQINTRASEEEQSGGQRVVDVFDRKNKGTYFNRVRGGYKLNQDGIEALGITKTNPDINDVGINSGNIGFYQALRDANEENMIYAGNIDGLQRAKAYENVEEVINDLVPC